MSQILRADVVAVDSVHVVIICPICGKFHWHGSNGILTDLNYGTRVPHCAGDDAGRFQGEYELVTSEHTIRRDKLRPRDIEAWRDIQRSKRATLEDQWEAQEEAERDDRILSAVRSIHAHGGRLARWRIALQANVAPYPRHRVDESTWHLLRQRAVPGHFQIAGWPGAEQDFWMGGLGMTEPEAFHQILLEQLSRAADDVRWIDERLSRGRRPGAGAV